jgi:hypothetical protein
MAKGYIIKFRKLKKNCVHNRLRWLGCSFRGKLKLPKHWPECTEKRCPILKTCELGPTPTVFTMYGQ